MKEEYINLLKSVKRKGINKLIDYLDMETDFFTAPASSKFHLSCEEGLLKHSLNVYHELVKESNRDDDSVIIVSLLHDICKTNYYQKNIRNIKDKDGNYKPSVYYTANDKFPVGHGEKSIIMILKFIELTEEEICAIRWHMGAYEPKESYPSLSSAFTKYPLSLQLHVADLKATYILEKES